MTLEQPLQFLSLAFPPNGAVRVHPEPAALPRLRREGPGRNRFDDPAGIIRLSGPVGRPISQAVSRAIYERISGVDGIGYWSRLDSTERCWAVYDHAPVRVEVVALDPHDASHKNAVATVAKRYEIPLPANWR